MRGLFAYRFTFTPLLKALSCSFALTGVWSFGRSKTITPLTLLPGLMSLYQVLAVSVELYIVAVSSAEYS